MGAGACSKCCGGSAKQPDANTVKGRPRVVFRDLHDLDVVLIRSSVGGTKVSHPIDLRVSSSIKFYNANYYMPPTNTFEKWDRIGFLQLPSAAIQPQHYSLDNLEVTEATETMVTTRTLRQVFESGAAEIAIRVLLLDGDASDETRANSSAAGMTGVAGGALAAAGAGLGLATSRVDAVTDQQKKRREEEMARRAEGVMARFYEFVPQLIRCPYAQAVEVVRPMLAFVRAQLDEFKVTEQQVQYMSNLLERYDRDNSGIEFDDLVSVFKELAKLNTSIQHPMNTLNSSEFRGLQMVDKYAKFADLAKDSKDAKAGAGAAAAPAPLREGYLHRSADNKAWGKEYAVLIESSLHLYTDHTKAKTNFSLALKGAVVEKTIDDASKDNQFSITAGANTTHFACDSEDDKTEWTKLLGRAIIKARLS